MDRDRPQAGEVEQRTVPLAAEGRKIRGVIPYGVESSDMGGWREVVEHGALRATRLDELIATVDHAGVPIGRFPTTLEVEDRTDGMHWAVTPPASRSDVREAVERGDLRSGSWSMVVGREEWRGDTRHVLEISELRDVSVVTNPAYPAAAVEYRAAPTPREDDMSEESTSEVRTEEERAEDTTEQRTKSNAPTFTPPSSTAGTLNVEDRISAPRRGLAAEYRHRGFPAERASMDWVEYTTVDFRSLAVSGVGDLSPLARQQGVGLGADQRYVFPVIPQTAVDAGTTSVPILRQKSRTLASTSDTIRDIDETSPKPEVTSELELDNVPLRQVAGVQTHVPNVYLAQPAANSIIERDLRLSLNEAIDKLVLDELASAGFESPTSSLVTAVREAIETIQSNGYAPDTLVLDPTSAVSLDTLLVDTTPELYVFPPGQEAGSIFGLRRRISKSAPAPVVLDSTAVGRLFVSPISLAVLRRRAGRRTRARSGSRAMPPWQWRGSTPPSASPQANGEAAQEEGRGAGPEAPALASRGEGGAGETPLKDFPPIAEAVGGSRTGAAPFFLLLPRRVPTEIDRWRG